jgi:Flp pilus assembly protein TadD
MAFPRHTQSSARMGNARRRARFGSALVVAALTVLAPVGCKNPRSPKIGDTIPGHASGAFGGSSVAKTDFKAEATADQAFNLHMELAKVRASESNFEAAISEYLHAIEISEKKGSFLSGAKFGAEKQALAHRRAAESFDMMGRFAQSDVHYSKALKLTPSDAKVWNSAGYSYYMQNRLADAERALKTAASFDRNDPKIQTNLGLTLAAAGKMDEALAALSKAGGPAVGQANLGFILAAMGKKDEAKKHYQIAVSLQPELAPARQALARLDSPTMDRAVSIASATMAVPETSKASASLPPYVSLNSLPPQPKAREIQTAVRGNKPPAGTSTQSLSKLFARKRMEAKARSRTSTKPSDTGRKDAQVQQTAVPPIPAVTLPATNTTMPKSG